MKTIKSPKVSAAFARGSPESSSLLITGGISSKVASAIDGASSIGASLDGHSSWLIWAAPSSIEGTFWDETSAKGTKKVIISVTF